MSIKNVMSLALKTLITVSLVLGAVGCAKKGQSGAAGGMDGSGIGDSMRFYGAEVTAEQKRAWLAQNTYIFGYDRFDLNDEDMMSVYAHAEKLITHPKKQIRVEGHTDERGSREYNIALGERRAKAVANILMLKGVPQHQISIVSYGKEKPAAMGHDESSWGQNRRAVIIYEME
jgi:peptidoglycan-associated lipoprotein